MALIVRVGPAHPLSSSALLERLKGLSTALVSDVLGRYSAAPGISAVSGLSGGQVVVGSAMTVRTRPGDNLVVHKALDLVRPGEVLVVAAGGEPVNAIIGGLMGQYARVRGVAAIVVDGAVRDVDELRQCAPPVFARSVSPLGPFKNGPGELRCDVSIAGVVIHDGDIIVGDLDGIAVIPRGRATETVELAEAQMLDEEQQRLAIANGAWERPWLDASLVVKQQQADGRGEFQTAV